MKSIRLFLPGSLATCTFCLLLGLSLAQSSSLRAQTNNPVPAAAAAPVEMVKPTLPNQLQSLVERAATQEDFRVIRNTALMQFQANLVDSLGRMRKEQARSKTQLADLEARLKKTEELLTQSETSYQEISTQRDSMSLLGLPVSKTSYQSVVGVLLALLAGIAGFFYFRFRSRNGETSRVEKLLLETQEEFDQYKKRAIDREQRLKRELQDELNKRS
ncbi:MAG: hypothetical protein GC205_07375 [Bacteroidetes bacterium]|nr:hypothetical protein [Bacteroidota bacterium]